MVSVMVAAGLLVAAGPHVQVICACQNVAAQPMDAAAGGCGGACAMETAQDAADHPSGCKCEDCAHVVLSASEVQLFIPGMFNFEYHDDIQPAVEFGSADGRDRNPVHTRNQFDTENRFTLQIANKLSAAVLIC